MLSTADDSVDAEYYRRLMREEALRDRRDSMRAARSFSDACARNDACALAEAVDALHSTCDGWRFAMRRVGRLTAISDATRLAFQPIWIESANLPLRVGHRPTLAAALRVLMPKNHNGVALRIFRGANSLELRRRTWGFSWTTDVDVARNFASRHRVADDHGIVLETVAPAEAVLWFREPEDYYDEREIVVDPYRLGKVSVVERLLADQTVIADAGPGMRPRNHGEP